MLVWGKVFKSEAKIAYLGNKRKHIIEDDRRWKSCEYTSMLPSYSSFSLISIANSVKIRNRIYY